MTPPARDPSLEQRLDGACAEVSGGSCGGTDTAEVVAQVTWDSSSNVHIAVTDAATGRRTERTLVFRTTDREMDRWQAAGLVVATLARSLKDGAMQDEPPEAVTRPPLHARALWISAGTLLGNGLTPGPPRIGAWARVAYRLPRSALWLGGGLSQAFAAGGAAGIDPTWTTLSAAFGATFTARSIDAEFRPSLEALVQHQSVRLERPDPGPPRKDAPDGGRWLPGLAADAELVWPVSSPVAVATGVSGTLLTGGTAVRVDGEKYASFPAASFAVTLGVRLSPW